MPGDVSALLGIPDIKLLSILRITCDVIIQSHESRKINSQTIKHLKAQIAEQMKTCRLRQIKWVMHDGKTNMPGYFRYSPSKAADKKQVKYLQTRFIMNSVKFSQA